MARNWIVRGDPTSSGGTVITGSPFTDIDGIAVARITDQATCPAHKGVFPIVDGDATLVVDGQPVALHGSSLACGCKVLSAAQMHVFVDAGNAAAAAPQSPASVTRPTQKPTPEKVEQGPNGLVAVNEGGAFSAAFLIRNQATGEPLKGAFYKLQLASGEVVEGQTGSNGKTSVAHSNVSEVVSVKISYRAEGVSSSSSTNSSLCESCEC